MFFSRKSTERSMASECARSSVPRSASAPMATLTAFVPGQVPFLRCSRTAQPTRSSRKRSACSPLSGKSAPGAPRNGSFRERLSRPLSRSTTSFTEARPSSRALWMARPSTASWLSSNHFQPGAMLEGTSRSPSTSTTTSPGRAPAFAAGPPSRTPRSENAACWCSVSALKPSMPELNRSGPSLPFSFPRSLRVGASWWRVTRSSPTVAAPPRARSSSATSPPLAARSPRSPIRPPQRPWSRPRTGRKASARADDPAPPPTAQVSSSSVAAWTSRSKRRNQPAGSRPSTSRAAGTWTENATVAPSASSSRSASPFGFSTRAPSAAGYEPAPWRATRSARPAGARTRRSRAGRKRRRAMGGV